MAIIDKPREVLVRRHEYTNAGAAGEVVVAMARLLAAVEWLHRELDSREALRRVLIELEQAGSVGAEDGVPPAYADS